jgi:hypothetical protein
MAKSVTFPAKYNGREGKRFTAKSTIYSVKRAIVAYRDDGHRVSETDYEGQLRSGK